MTKHEFDLNLVYGFDALWQLRSVSLAAERMHVSQPTMSGILARLRRSFNDQLFIWDGSTMRPTERAEQLAPRVRRLLEDATSLRDPALDHEINVERTVVIAAAEYLIPMLSTRLLPLLERDAPRLRLSFIPNTPKVHGPEGRAGVSLVVIPHSAIVDLDVMRRTLYRDEYVVIGGSRFFERRRRIDEATFIGTEHAMLSLHPATVRNQIARQAPALQERLKGRYLFQSMLSLMHMVADSPRPCLGIVPRRAVLYSPLAARLRMFEAPVELPVYEMGLYWSAADHHDPVTRWLRNAVVDILGPAPASGG